MEKRIFLNRYRLSRGRNDAPVELHRTPTSVTYRAQETESGREVALELVTAEVSNPGLRELLESEAEATRQIRQINVPALYDFGFDRGDLIYVTEYFDGHTATAWVTAHGPLAPDAVLHAALQVVAAMDAMAFHRIHHHALNPDNLIFLAEPVAAVDWPSVRVLHWLGVAPLFAETGDPRLDRAARFASPEQLYTGKVDVRSEIFSLGCTMWFLLTGAAPAGVQSAAADAASLSLHELQGVPKIVTDLISRMLRFEPDERPQDPVALGAYLQTCLTRIEKLENRRKSLPAPDAPGAAAARKEIARPARKPAMRRKSLALAALLIALASLAAFAVPHYLGGFAELPSVFKSSRSALQSRDAPAIVSAPAVEPSPSGAPKPTDGPVVEVPRSTLSTITNAESSSSEPPPPEEGPATDVALASASSASGATAISADNSGLPRGSENPALFLDENYPNREESTPSASISAPSEDISEDSPAPDGMAPAAPSGGEDSAAPSLSAPEPSANVTPQRDAPEPSIVSVPSAGKGENDHSTKALTTKSHSSRPVKARTTARKSSRTKERRKPSSTEQIAVKRAKPLPELRFGASRAELVGTTSDGQWILTVASTGKRVIVPPPPGFAVE